MYSRRACGSSDSRGGRLHRQAWRTRSLDILACAERTGGNLSDHVDSRVGATGEGNHTARGAQDLNAEPLHGLGRRDGGLARSAASLPAPWPGKTAPGGNAVLFIPLEMLSRQGEFFRLSHRTTHHQPRPQRHLGAVCDPGATLWPRIIIRPTAYCMACRIMSGGATS